MAKASSKTIAGHKAAAKPIIDVSHPGTALPSDTAKSIMVTNRPMMQDSMLHTPDEPSDSLLGAPLLDLAPKVHAAKPAIAEPKKVKKEIIPPSEAAAQPIPEKADATEVSVKVVAPVAADSIPETPPSVPNPDPEPAAEKPVPKAPIVAPAEATPEAEDSAETEDEPEAEAPTVVDKKQAAADAAQAAKVDGLIKHQVYVLPINAVERRHARHFVVGGFLLIIILALAWLDLAADAGFIHLSHLPLTHFFRV